MLSLAVTLSLHIGDSCPHADVIPLTRVSPLTLVMCAHVADVVPFTRVSPLTLARRAHIADVISLTRVSLLTLARCAHIRI